MANNTRCVKSCLIFLRFILRRIFFIFVLSSTLNADSLSWLAISNWVSILLFLILDLFIVRVFLLFLFFLDRSFFFSFSDFVVEAGLKSLHLSVFSIHQASPLDIFSAISQWSFFALLCYEILILISLLLYCLAKPSKRRTLKAPSQGRLKAQSVRSIGSINPEETQNLNEELHPREQDENSRVEKAPGDYRSFVLPALLIIFTLIVLVIFGIVTLVSGVAIVGLQLGFSPYEGRFPWIQISNWIAFGEVAFALVEDLVFMGLEMQIRKKEGESERFLKQLFLKYESHNKELNQSN